MSFSVSENWNQRSIDRIARKAYQTIARTFPICAASDEFYFFPQVIDEQRDWMIWDDFSAESVIAVCSELQSCEAALADLDPVCCADADLVDRDVLQKMLRTLCEQLSDVAPHRQQPTFHLTILAAGLAEALTSADPKAWASRVHGVPRFLQRAIECLDRVPVRFLDLGQDMAADLQSWGAQLRQSGHPVDGLAEALTDFAATLKQLPVIDGFRLPDALLEHLVMIHLGCDCSIDSVTAILEEEYLAMNDVLQEEAGHLMPGRHWTEAESLLPFIVAPDGDLLMLYRRELAKQLDHCRQRGLLPDDLPDDVLQLTPVPDYLAVIRASDAYSAIPGYPPRGGTFYVMERGRSRDGRTGRTPEYRMTAVHEVWPGHHVLDLARWCLQNPVRRPIEQPLFYEGWACLAEELMARTGYLDGPWDRFLLARRRIERAARGLIDLGLQSGRMQFTEAIELLISTGYRPEVARSVVPKYLLRPGYQVCYTMGLRQGLDLLTVHGRHDPGQFVRRVLAHGEIGFPRLSELLAAEPGP